MYVVTVPGTSANGSAAVWSVARHCGQTRPGGRLRAPHAALGSVVVRALGLANRFCWDSLECGDALAFSRRVAICADLWEFSVCACLVEEVLAFD